MRSLVKLLALSSASLLSACGADTGLQTVGSVAPPSGGGSTGTTPTPSPTSAHTFVTPTEIKTYEAIGGVQHYEYGTRSDGNAQSGQLYAGDANTVRDSGISVNYNPRDAIFEVTINRPAGSVITGAMRFQDPAHRTDFGGAREPQASVPELPVARNIQYLQSGSGTGSTLGPADPYNTAGLGTGNSDYPVGAKGYSSTVQTFFYQKPGTTTQYVTYAGFVRNSVTATETQDNSTSPLYLKESYSFDRAAFAYGERTANSAVPRTGSGTYSGEMIATMVFNPMLDTNSSYPTYFQWIAGTHTTNVNFASLGVTSSFTGTVSAPARDAYSSGAFFMPAGSVFNATSTATIDLVNKGGFSGNFGSASFTLPNTTTFTVNIAGSSIDGAFFGPNGEEIGGGFRIVGGTPDERIDILGTFTGKK